MELRAKLAHYSAFLTKRQQISAAETGPIKGPNIEYLWSEMMSAMEENQQVKFQKRDEFN